MLKSQSDNWKTPKDLYNALNQIFNFDFDPCPLNPDFDGLSIEWGKRNFVNPPYSNLIEWVKKADLEAFKGKLVVMLIPSRTDTKAFHNYIKNKAEYHFIRGRLKFNEKTPAPFSSMIVIFYGQLRKWLL